MPVFSSPDRSQSRHTPQPKRIRWAPGIEHSQQPDLSCRDQVRGHKPFSGNAQHYYGEDVGDRTPHTSYIAGNLDDQAGCGTYHGGVDDSLIFTAQTCQTRPHHDPRVTTNRDGADHDQTPRARESHQTEPDESRGRALALTPTSRRDEGERGSSRQEQHRQGYVGNLNASSIQLGQGVYPPPDSSPMCFRLPIRSQHDQSSEPGPVLGPLQAQQSERSILTPEDAPRTPARAFTPQASWSDEVRSSDNDDSLILMQEHDEPDQPQTVLRVANHPLHFGEPGGDRTGPLAGIPPQRPRNRGEDNGGSRGAQFSPASSGPFGWGPQAVPTGWVGDTLTGSNVYPPGSSHGLTDPFLSSGNRSPASPQMSRPTANGGAFGSTQRWTPYNESPIEPPNDHQHIQRGVASLAARNVSRMGIVQGQWEESMPSATGHILADYQSSSPGKSPFYPFFHHIANASRPRDCCKELTATERRPKFRGHFGREDPTAG